MRDNDWVLWIDSDIENVPTDLIQQFLNVSTDVMTVACLVKKNGHTMNYDFNTRRFGDEKCGDYCLPFLRHEGRVVRLDIVGTSVLMVRSDVHRKVRFPEVRERLESEGFAINAKKMGYEIVGLPFVEMSSQKCSAPQLPWKKKRYVQPCVG
ncbi:MNN9-like protein [Mya arenaria]|uniref:MNN9-like protein n=1 Tax=Mya arenaria TaxID=6604 RepID=A0ABY7G385_MYAAR|nr:MNN9-like protein [Mya arenaria]